MPRGSLLLVDGLPGSGKSTLAHLLTRRLRAAGIAARWYWELESPHPLFDPAVPSASDVLQEGFAAAALTRWTQLAAGVAAGEQVVILESSFLQSPLQPMFALGWPAARIAEYVDAVDAAIAKATPLLALLRYTDVAAGFEASARLRGAWFAEQLAAKLAATPYARERSLTGAAAVKAYLCDYQALTDACVARLRMPVVRLDAHAGESAALSVLAHALQLPHFTEPAGSLDCAAYVGTYCRPDTGDACRIVTDGTHLYVAGEPDARLLPVDGDTFEVLATCVQYRFARALQGSVVQLECRGNLPGLAPRWVKSPWKSP